MTRAKQARCAAILILTAAALVNIALHAWRDQPRNAGGRALLSQLQSINSPHSFDTLFTELIPLLKEARTVGYASQIMPEKMNTDIEASALYYQTQYALCPVIVDYSTDHQHVVALILARNLPLNVNSNTHELVNYFSTGVVLFKQR